MVEDSLLKITRRSFLKALTKMGLLAMGAGLAGCLGEKKLFNATPTIPLARPTVKGKYISGSSGGDAETLNWILVSDATSFSYIDLIMDGLVTYDNQFNILLRWLEKDIEVSEDGLLYTVTIRDDLEWSDGKPVTAEDFIYTMKNLMFADWMAYTYAGDWQEQVEGKTFYVEPKAENETTFTIKRRTVDPEFLYTVTDLRVYPKHIVSKYEGDIRAFTQAPELNNLSYAGNLGPYKFKEWVRNDKFVVQRNLDYYLGKERGEPYFEEYIIKIFGTSAARQAALEAGDITSTTIEPEHVRKFREMPGIQVYTVPTAQYQIMQYNMRDNGWPGLRDKRVRQAISMAISKEAIIQQVRLGFGEPAFSFIPRSSPWYVGGGLKEFGVGELYDKKKARQLLIAAGYREQIRLKLITNTGSKVAESTAFLVKQELLDLNIIVDIRLVPWETMLRKYYMNKVPGSDQSPRNNNGPRAISEEPWDLILAGHGTDPMQPSGSEVFFTTNGGLNTYGYSNSRVDELFARAHTREALDKTARREIYAETSRILSEDQPVDFLVFPTMNIGFKSNVRGIDPGISIGYNYQEWYYE